MKYRYGMINRPPSLGCVPRGLSFEWDSGYRDASKNIRHGIIVCDRKLTADEIYQFELVDLNGGES